MQCPRCGHIKNKVLRVDKFDTLNRRIRECLNVECRNTWLTYETPAMQEPGLCNVVSMHNKRVNRI